MWMLCVCVCAFVRKCVLGSYARIEFFCVFLRTKNKRKKIVFTTSLTKKAISLPKNSFYNSTNFTTNITNVEFPLAEVLGPLSPYNE
jgi:hypothetical protein